MAQKLMNIIKERKNILGSTAEGVAWCTKALHPSDPLSESRGIPDESAVPSTFVNYQSVYSLTPGGEGTWGCDGQLIPNPLSFGAISNVITTGSVVLNPIEFVNSQIAGATHAARMQTFLNNYLRWRLAYMSVTIYQDGPDLANQGTVCVCQKPVEPQQFNLVLANIAESTATAAVGSHHAFHMDAQDLPSYEKSQAMPNAYFGRSREGAYIPLKLTKTHQQWHSVKDLVYQANSATLNWGTGIPQYDGQLALANSTDLASQGVYPFLSVDDVHQYITEGSNVLAGTLTSPFCNENWADFSFRNLSSETSLSFFFRAGFEVQVDPTSAMSPFLKLSPPHDQLAIETYFAIARELKDAYPADFNDAGKIWDVISSIAKAVAPGLAFIPGIGPALGGLVGAASFVGDSISRLVKNKNDGRGSIASEADKERAAKAADEAISRHLAALSSTIPRPQAPKPKPKITVVYRRPNNGK